MESQDENIIGRLNEQFPQLPRWQVALLAGIVVYTIAHALLLMRTGAEWQKALTPLVPLYCLWRLGPSIWWRRAFWLVANCGILWLLVQNDYDILKSL